MTTDYVPIDCDRHSVLELLAMRRTGVSVEARDAAGAGLTVHGVVVDVFTRDGAEFLLLHTAAGGDAAIRLDRLQAVYDAAGSLLRSPARFEEVS